MHLHHRNVTLKRRRLPHWQADEGTYFVTFRLFDSLPRDLSAPRKTKEIEELLDRGSGSAFLLSPEVASIVFGAMTFFHGDRYVLHTACVMPNHVHVVFRTLAHHGLSDIIHSWKSFSANQANRVLGRTGPFWEREWFDCLIPDENRLERANAYVIANPAKAGLTDWPWVERFDTPFYVKYKV